MSLNNQERRKHTILCLGYATKESLSAVTASKILIFDPKMGFNNSEESIWRISGT